MPACFAAVETSSAASAHAASGNAARAAHRAIPVQFFLSAHRMFIDFLPRGPAGAAARPGKHSDTARKLSPPSAPWQSLIAERAARAALPSGRAAPIALRWSRCGGRTARRDGPLLAAASARMPYPCRHRVLEGGLHGERHGSIDASGPTTSIGAGSAGRSSHLENALVLDGLPDRDVGALRLLR